MKKLLYIVFSFILTACSNVEIIKKEVNQSPEIETGNIQCLNAAKYARSMSVLMQSGISASSIEEYISTTKVVTFPIKTIQHYVMKVKGTPADAYNSIYALCDRFGWQNLEIELKTLYPSSAQSTKTKITEKDEKFCFTGKLTIAWILSKDEATILYHMDYDKPINERIEFQEGIKIYFICH